MFLTQMQERLYVRMTGKIAGARQRTGEAAQMDALMKRSIAGSRHRMQLFAASLEQLSPLARLSGGYGFVTDKDGRNVRSVRQVSAGDLIFIQLSDGRIDAKAQTITEDIGYQNGREESFEGHKGRKGDASGNN